MADVPTFAEFYAAVHGGRQPFPWQARLARRVAAEGDWPAEIGVPTGLGKTSCLDIAVWSLAVDSASPPDRRRAPTRVWWVVNRRLLVDDTTNHAEELAGRLADSLGSGAADPALSRVAELLAERSVTGRPLEVIRLRGGAAVGRPSNPAQPAIVLSTIPMYGSRLLFGGYGVSRSMRPIDAALAGTDSLVLIDEAHLARHLVELFPPLVDCDPGRCHPLLVPRQRPTVVALTATGAVAQEDRFDLDAEDLANPVVRERVDATKPTRLQRPSGKTERALAEAALELLGRGGDGPRSCVVFANTPATARATYDRLTKALQKRNAAIEADVELLTGRIREREAADVRSRILLAARTGADRTVRNLVVVATQTLEVGADLDFDLLVTEACGVRALTQRLGRLNRLGTKSQAEAVYCHVAPGKGGVWPVYGTEPAEVIERLEAGCNDADQVDLGPARIGLVLGQPADEGTSAPAVLPALLWEWVKTTTPPPGAAPVEPYFSGLQPKDRTLSLVWRAYVPSNGDPIWPGVTHDESVDIPIAEARAVLDGMALVRLGVDRRGTEVVETDDLRPGDIVVVPADAGRYDDFGWAPDADDRPAIDMAVLRSGIPIEEAALRRLFGDSAPPDDVIARVIDPSPDADEVEIADAERELVAALRAAAPVGYEDSEWAELRDDLGHGIVFPVGEVPRVLRQRPATVEARSDELDENSLAMVIDLQSHGVGVAERARAIADALGLPEDLALAVERAARFHDAGKIDPRFQRWLDPSGAASRPVAKSDPKNRSRWQADRVAAGWPLGGRHEELSRRLVEEWIRQVEPGHSDLIAHLVVSHHGHGRPFLIPVEDRAAGCVSGELEGREVTAGSDLSVADWSQPTRFHSLCAEFGHWGLALLEAVVRQADHEVSAGRAGRWEVL